MECIARAIGVGQKYKGRLIFDGFDLSINEGVTGLLGPNGAGKSTLLRTLATVAPPSSGSIELFGQRAVTERQIRHLRRDIGYLPQRFGFYSRFTVFEFVSYCAWLREIPKREVGHAARDAINAVGLSEQCRDKMKSLSGGMLQRAGIATAIVGRPLLILLDEPTVGLDPIQRIEFRELVRSLNRDGSSVILSTHLIEDVAAACDSVTILDGGRVLYQDTLQNFAKRDGSQIDGATLEETYMSILNGNKAVA